MRLQTVRPSGIVGDPNDRANAATAGEHQSTRRLPDPRPWQGIPWQRLRSPERFLRHRRLLRSLGASPPLTRIMTAVILLRAYRGGAKRAARGALARRPNRNAGPLHAVVARLGILHAFRRAVRPAVGRLASGCWPRRGVNGHHQRCSKGNTCGDE
jgi:hypothetical protein